MLKSTPLRTNIVLVDLHDEGSQREFVTPLIFVGIFFTHKTLQRDNLLGCIQCTLLLMKWKHKVEPFQKKKNILDVEKRQEWLMKFKNENFGR